jgi:hypothetical protein
LIFLHKGFVVRRLQIASDMRAPNNEALVQKSAAQSHPSQLNGHG